MQLKPVINSRFSEHWSHYYPLIKAIFNECCIEKKRVNEKFIILKQGARVKELTLVHTGKISIGYTAGNGRGFQLGTMKCDEQVFGEMEFFTHYPCQFNIVAKEALAISTISTERLEKALLQHPQLALFFASAIAIDYQETLDIFLNRTLYPISYNIAFDIYQKHMGTQPVNSCNKDYLEAERFCTTDRVYRRAIKHLIDLDIIEKKNQELTIKNFNLLKKFLNSQT